MIDEYRFSHSNASLIVDCRVFFICWEITGQLWDFIPPMVFDLAANDDR